MRSVVAAWLALCVAYGLELEMPYSAATTVLLVINPIQGAVIGKGAWRVLGTLAGMIASILLMSAFGQMPWCFLLGFAAWLGLCVAGMTLLRHFRASGVVVAGYTSWTGDVRCTPASASDVRACRRARLDGDGRRDLSVVGHRAFQHP
ncbi:FUSC family protein [Pandoraea sp. NPDC087047]|uniref:FUSC family protein n=1 Tax=Pandoraea sp. NPDC087047 TaxID=3364390 RepID=UPI0038211C3D